MISYLVKVPVSKDASGPEGFVPAVKQFYRKHFRLPSAWQEGISIRIEVGGAVYVSTVSTSTSAPAFIRCAC